MLEKRLLVLDDQEPFANYVERVAERQGYEGRIALHAKDFMKLFEVFDPTVVVLDIVMPDTDGIEMARWLKYRNFKGRLLFVTGYNPHFATWAKHLSEISNFAQVGSMTKPVSNDALKSFLR